ncbi:glycosyltransferase [bacterium]|nr:glycosyltransferase [bacterium]
MSFGAFVMTFNRPAILQNTLSFILSQSTPPSKILVVDNGSDKETQEVVNSFSAHNVVYHDMGDNVGPAGATAYALARLVDEGYEWIYWVDDDDPPLTSTTLERLLDLVSSEKDEKIGGTGAVGSRFDWSIGEMKRIPSNALHGTLDVDIIGGNQQLILSSKMIKEVGVANPNLFFGLYEPEYCLRIRRSGFRLIVDGEFMLQHRTVAGRENSTPKRSLIPPYNFNNMWQRYYRTRNYIHMMRRTFHRPDLARREALKAMARTVTAWGKGPRYGLEFGQLQLQGVVDGYQDRMGRTISPRPKYQFKN